MTSHNHRSSLILLNYVTFRSSNPPQGICISGKCSCLRPFYGEDCQTKILDPKLDKENLDFELEEGQDFTFQPGIIEGRNII